MNQQVRICEEHIAIGEPIVDILHPRLEAEEPQPAPVVLTPTAPRSPLSMRSRVIRKLRHWLAILDRFLESLDDSPTSP
jgi:hypothetical protein